jgi:hypothetical protein
MPVCSLSIHDVAPPPAWSELSGRGGAGHAVAHALQSRCDADGPTVWISCPAPSRTGTLARSRREVVKLGLRTMVPLPWEGDRKAQQRNADQRDEPAVALKVP